MTQTDEGPRPGRSLVVMAGKQLWPALQCVSFWRNQPGGLGDVHLFFTLEEDQSKLPALRLARLLSLLFPELRLIVPAAGLGNLPQHFSAQVNLWMAATPDREWILTAAAEFQTAAFGLSSFVGRADTRIFLHDPRGDWFEWLALSEAPGSRFTDFPELRTTPMDALPVEVLMRSQCDGHDPRMELSSQPTAPLPVKWLTEVGAANGWNWPAAFKTCGQEIAEAPLALFKRYLAAALLEAGISQIARDLKFGEANRKEPPVFDLVVNHHGRLVILDVDLTEEPDEQPGDVQPVPSQWRRARLSAEALSGLAARWVMVRPCRSFTDIERELAKSYGVTVVDQTEAPKLFSRLANVFGLAPLPELWSELERILVQLVATRGRRRVFGPEPRLLREQEAASGSSAVVDLESYLARLCITRGQNWILWSDRERISLRLTKPANAPEHMQELIQNGLRVFGRVQVQEISGGYEAVFLRSDQALKLLQTALAGFVNRALDPMIFLQAAPKTPPPARPLRDHVTTPPTHKPAAAPRRGPGSRGWGSAASKPGSGDFIQDLEQAFDSLSDSKP